MTNRAIAQPFISQAGLPGAPGEGLPTGGAAGSIPYKASTDDYDTAWATTVTLTDDENYSGIYFNHPVLTNITAGTVGEDIFASVDIYSDPTEALIRLQYSFESTTGTVEIKASDTENFIDLIGANAQYKINGADARSQGRITETKNDDYTPPATDAGKLLLFDKATAVTCTINTDLNLTAGQDIKFIQIGAGLLSFVAGSGVTINTLYTLDSLGQYATQTLTCVGTDTYVLSGELATP